MSARYGVEEMRRWHQEVTLANWANGGEVMRYVFLHMAEFFPHALIHRSGPISALEHAARDDVRDRLVDTRLGQMPLDTYVWHPESTVNGLIVVHQGWIVYEAYPRMRPFDKHMYMSVAKVFASTALALLADRGLVDVTAPVEAYLPELAGSGWAGVPVIDILDMASGIDCLEMTPGAYSEPGHPYYEYEASLGWQVPSEQTLASTRAYLATLGSQRPSGEVYEYTSPDTFVLSWLVEQITGQPFNEVLSEEIWSKLGAESDALIAVSRAGEPASHGGMSSTLRDLARFGLLFTPSWNTVARERVISDAYLEKIQHGGRADIFWAAGSSGPNQVSAFATDDRPRHNTWQWDFVMPDGDFYKGGFGGQGLYISPSRDLVVAFFGCTGEDMISHDLKAITRRLAVDLF
jgi:CubicO group peptidase (beta-lactamase class C family)